MGQGARGRSLKCLNLCVSAGLGSDWSQGCDITTLMQHVEGTGKRRWKREEKESRMKIIREGATEEDNK